MSYKNITNATTQTELKLETSFFHVLGKVFIKQGQNVFESEYKSSHNISKSEIWTDDVPYAATVIDADNNNVNLSQITKYTNVRLYPLQGSNQQVWYFDSTAATFGTSNANASGYKPQTFVRPWISPVDAPSPTDNSPSYGYSIILKDSNGNIIGSGDGTWEIDFYAGMIKFAVGKTPNITGWGISTSPAYDTANDTNYPTLTFYAYTGRYLADTLVNIGAGFDIKNYIIATTTSTPNNNTNHKILNNVVISDYKPNTMLEIKVNGIPLILKTTTGAAPTTQIEGECYFGTGNGVNSIGLNDLTLNGSYSLFLGYNSYTGSGTPITEYDILPNFVVSIVYTKNNS